MLDVNPSMTLAKDGMKTPPIQAAPRLGPGLVAPELVALGQAHVAASPGGAWPGPLPASTPSWFTSLPCQ